MNNKNKIVQNWIKNHGAASFDFKNKNIILYDGGLFSIEQKEVLRQKVIGLKKLPNSNFSKVIFSKKKYKSTDYFALLWIQELDSTISYLQSMSRMLRKIGFKTNYNHFRNI